MRVYGKHGFGTEISDEFYLKLDRNYVRECSGERVEKLVAGGKNFIVNPVEPVNLPKEITNLLFIEFSKSVSVEPGRSVRIYLKFPVEIAVFVEGEKLSVIDVFTLAKPKFALYGTPSKGAVCRYCFSEVYDELPEVNGFYEGVMELTLRNSFDEWVEVRKAIFDGYGMKIYYSDYPSMVAVMRIESRSVAVTRFLNKPLETGMEKAVELYTARRFVERKKYVMEWGF